MRGFFAGSQIASGPPLPVIPECGACGLYKTCEMPKVPVTGEGRRRILIVGESPGDDDALQLLRKSLDRLGVDLDADCWYTFATICQPPDGRPPAAKEVDYCRPNVTKAIRTLNPEIIILLGQGAVRSVIGPLWKGEPGSIQRWVGWQIPTQALNAWVCPVWHPGYLIRMKDNPVVNRMFYSHLKQAVRCEGRPWPEGRPHWEKEIRRTLDVSQAAKWLRGVAAATTGTVAFDYETNMLKPDHPEARILSASVAWGREHPERVFAFPWHGEAISAFQELVRSPLPKIAANMKFEDRWTRMAFGHRVRNWWWDTMLAAHVADCRPEISGLKFQSFVRLGMPAFNDHIEPFLKSSKSERTNRAAKEIDIMDLLLYNGLDSLLEFRLAMLQANDLNYPRGT